MKQWSESINLGIKSGCKDAFIIDDDTKRALVDNERKSAELIKPILNNRSIKRYWTQWSDLWFIATHNGYGHVPAIDIDDYPAIKAPHLDGYYRKLRSTARQGEDALQPPEL